MRSGLLSRGRAERQFKSIYRLLLTPIYYVLLLFAKVSWAPLEPFEHSVDRMSVLDTLCQFVDRNNNNNNNNMNNNELAKLLLLLLYNNKRSNYKRRPSRRYEPAARLSVKIEINAKITSQY